MLKIKTVNNSIALFSEESSLPILYGMNTLRVVPTEDGIELFIMNIPLGAPAGRPIAKGEWGNIQVDGIIVTKQNYETVLSTLFI